jgi:amidase
MERRDFVGAMMAVAVGSRERAVRREPGAAGSRLARLPAHGSRLAAPDTIDEATIADLQRWMAERRVTAAELVEHYVRRIERLDRAGPALRSVLETNPDAAAIAARLDAEREAGRVRGPLHGIPVLLKDNIDTGDRMMTTAGSLALAGASAPHDAPIVARLREAGAVILGKTNLSEWANFRSSRSSSGWSARGGQTRNPYALDRNPCGSSSGTGAAIAASLAAVGLGTETDGSIVCPSNNCGLVGLKPTVGLVSRTGIVPISHTQDTAGPMTRTVADAAVLLGALVGPDPADAATARAAGRAEADYVRFLDEGALRGARLGVARQHFGFHAGTDAVLEEALRALREAGAVLVDPVTLPTDAAIGAHEIEVLLYEFKHGVAAYLQSRRPGQPHRTLADLIAFNAANAERELAWFGQELFERAERKGPLADLAYRRALAECARLARTEGLDRAFATHRLDAIVAPTGGPAWLTDLVNGDHFMGGSSTISAVAGYPSLTVPAGQVRGLPVGISFMGRAWSEGRLLALGHAFERATRARRPPTFRPGADA